MRASVARSRAAIGYAPDAMVPALSSPPLADRRRPIPFPSRAIGVVALVFSLLACATGGSGDREDARVLRFRDAADRVVEKTLASLRAACPSGVVTVDDPYHERAMTYDALELRCVLDEGFAARGGSAGLGEVGLLLRALDGYTRPASGRDLLAPGGHLAFGESARPEPGSRFTPIDRRQVDPAPFYMVWTGAGQNDPHQTPWPYQLAEIAIAPFEAAFPATVPTGLDASDAGWAGYRLFQRACASCHAINGQGGKVGPDLNAPRSIVEYRPIEQIRAYVRDPGAFRYTSMPAHPGLSDADLDALIAYFSAMRERKQDPRGRTAGEAKSAEAGG